jgi:hypothetical protein
MIVAERNGGSLRVQDVDDTCKNNIIESKMDANYYVYLGDGPAAVREGNCILKWVTSGPVRVVVMSWRDLYNFDQYDTFLRPEDSDVAYATYQIQPDLSQIVPGFAWCRRCKSCRGELCKGGPIHFASVLLPSHALAVWSLTPISRFLVCVCWWENHRYFVNRNKSNIWLEILFKRY